MKNRNSKFWAIAILGVAILSKSFTVQATDPPSATDKQKYYQVVFIWMKDPQKFQEYGEKMGPIVARYGGAGERIITPVSTYYNSAKEGRNPDMVNIVYYDSKDAYERFERDPDFQKISHLRDQSIDMAGIGGFATEGEIVSGAVAERLYMIELAYFKDGNSKKYDDYKKQSKAFNSRHGMTKERVISPTEVFGDMKKPDQVTIMYYDKEERKAAMQADAEHEKIEGLYAESISGLVWVEGKAAFVNMQ